MKYIEKKNGWSWYTDVFTEGVKNAHDSEGEGNGEGEGEGNGELWQWKYL